MKLNIFWGCLIFFFTTVVYGAQAPVEEQPPKIGNFILPPSQQPGSLIGFGQSVIDRNETQLFLFGTDYAGVDQYMVTLTPSILYGLTDSLSILFNLPIAASFKENQNYSSGLQDASLQFEYAFYKHSTHSFSDQATIVTSVSFPTGSSTKDPSTGLGSPSYFVGGTFLRTYVDWLVFTAQGAVFTTSEHNTQFGNQFLYQAGFGRNIFDIDSSWIFAWILEIDGQYTEKNKINGAIDPNSGGNVIYATPSLWISSQRLIIQLGAGLPVTQHLFGDQNRNKYLLVFDLGWTF